MWPVQIELTWPPARLWERKHTHAPLLWTRRALNTRPEEDTGHGLTSTHQYNPSSTSLMEIEPKASFILSSLKQTPSPKLNCLCLKRSKREILTMVLRLPWTLRLKSFSSQAVWITSCVDHKCTPATHNPNLVLASLFPSYLPAVKLSG